jgi:PKD repeat protein
LETARIFSQYDFKRSIVYCAFTAEECGLDGSGQYAQKCQNEGMNIVGYFNLDMSGYLKPGTEIHMSLINPTSANPLADYFVSVCDVYFPTIPIQRYTNLSDGDSDHTSFNQKGYQGIWWFEDWNYCSPEIHTPNDKIGPSVNSPEQVKIFAQAMVASMSILAELAEEAPKLVIPDFTASETAILEDNLVQFTDLSLNEPINWHWYFEGGTPNYSEEQHPEVFYENPGSYSVKLVVSNEISTDSLLKENYITVKMLPPIADFVADVTEIEEGDTVTFTNLSQQNPEFYSWFFAGGSPLESEEKDPVVIYQREGVFPVSLSVVNAGGESTEQKENYIKVKPKTAISDPTAGALESAITVYPNPTAGELKIMNYVAGQARNDAGIGNIEIYDVFGKRVASVETLRATSLQQPTTTLDISHLPSGVYFIRIQTTTGIVIKKMVKLE